VLFRVIVIGKAKGCGFYLFGALLGCIYQLIISPLRWADSTAQHMAKRVELGLIEGAEDNAVGDGHGGRSDDCGGRNGTVGGITVCLNTALQVVPTEQERQAQDECASAPAKD
jgi:hypothetical protein